MSATKTQAFVLKTQDYRDTSLLVSLYTKDFGKIRGIVKGIRENQARFGSTLEPFSLNEILFYRRRKGADLHQVTQADLVDPFWTARHDLEQLSYANYLLDLVDTLVEVDEPNEAIFNLIKDAIDFMQSGASPRRTARIFEMKLLDELGLAPELGACVVCRRMTPDPAYFSVSQGGLLCEDCHRKRDSGLRFSQGAILFLDRVRRQPFQALRPVKVSKEVGMEVERALKLFRDHHLSYPLKTVLFLEKMGYLS